MSTIQSLNYTAISPEIIKFLEDDKEKEVWTGDYIFDNEWQSFRTKKNNDLELTSPKHEYAEKGKYKIFHDTLLVFFSFNLVARFDTIHKDTSDGQRELYL